MVRHSADVCWTAPACHAMLRSAPPKGGLRNTPSATRHLRELAVDELAGLVGPDERSQRDVDSERLQAPEVQARTVAASLEPHLGDSRRRQSRS
jgi:hypothetical protein